MREHLIEQIKELLAPLIEETRGIDCILAHKSEKELKALIKRINIQNKLWQENNRRNNGKSR